MRKCFYLLLFILFCLTTTSFAQTFGIKAGLNSPLMLIKWDEHRVYDESKLLNNFTANLGFTLNFELKKRILFETGIGLSTVGFKHKYEAIMQSKTTQLTYKITENYNFKLNYLNIPLNLKFLYNIENRNLYFTFGPYLGIGISGKYHLDYPIEKKNINTGEYVLEQIIKDRVVNWGSDSKDDFKRLDYGVSVGLGCEIDNFQIGLSYSYGLPDISPRSDETYKNRVLGISMGWLFE